MSIALDKSSEKKADQMEGNESLRPSPAPSERTLGMKIVDSVLYGAIVNTAVLVISVVATYLTTHGGKKNDKGELVYGAVGQWFNKRGEDFIDLLTDNKSGKGWVKSTKTADEYKQIAFSFLDGSVMAFPTALMENHSMKVARWVDDRLGTTPEDKSVYENQPKKTLRDILIGRAATLAFVLPTAKMLSKKSNEDGARSFNDVVLNEPGEAVGKFINKHTGIQEKLPNIDVAGVAKTTVFEGFYTAICTVGLYVFSGISSKLFGNKEEKVEHKPANNIANFNRNHSTEVSNEHADSEETKWQSRLEPKVVKPIAPKENHRVAVTSSKLSSRQMAGVH